MAFLSFIPESTSCLRKRETIWKWKWIVLLIWCSKRFKRKLIRLSCFFNNRLNTSNLLMRISKSWFDINSSCRLHLKWSRRWNWRGTLFLKWWEGWLVLRNLKDSESCFIEWRMGSLGLRFWMLMETNKMNSCLVMWLSLKCFLLCIKKVQAWSEWSKMWSVLLKVRQFLIYQDMRSMIISSWISIWKSRTLDSL